MHAYKQTRALLCTYICIDVSRLVGTVDSDGDGVIDLKEFAAICRDGL